LSKLLVGVIHFSFAATAQSADEITIKNSLETHKWLAWNRGDLSKRFMDTYWKSDSLMFIGKSGVTYGWQNTRWIITKKVTPIQLRWAN
jgi:hypothetical protein